MENKNIANWEDIYGNKKAGSFMSYPSEQLVTLFHQNKRHINQAGRCLDYGFGSGNNTEFLIQHMGEMSGVEISQSSIDIAANRLTKYPGFDRSRLYLNAAVPLEQFEGAFDLIVAWQMLYYNDREGIRASIDRLHQFLKPDGILIATLVTNRDIKVRHANKVAESTYVIDERIPHQQGCTIFCAESETDFLALFPHFEHIDHGHYERASSMTENTASEYYLVGRKA